jgi:hypothetical protein
VTHRASLMPSFASPSFGFRHTVDSALRILADLGVPAARITVRMAGAGHAPRTVVGQQPAAGTPLDGAQSIVLSVAGFGCFNALPVGMWDRGGDDEPGTLEIVELFDDPLQKAGHWIREGARLFHLQPENTEDCARWISLFGLAPEDWPPSTWYNLSLLLPGMWRLANTEQGIRLMFRLLLQLPIKQVRELPSTRPLPPEHLSLLGAQASRLSIDCTVGNLLEDFSRLQIVIGPVPLATYYDFQGDEQRRLLAQVTSLCVRGDRACESSWLVSDATQMARLGYETENTRLGINSYLGGEAGRRTDT